jgi:hypothetical protein
VDNAEIFGQTGAAMYYNEKLSQELAKNGKIRPLSTALFKVKVKLSVNTKKDFSVDRCAVNPSSVPLLKIYKYE